MTTNITVTNLKGGVGKTTVSGLLAKFLLEHQSDPVVLIDLDPQCGSTSLFLGKDAHSVTIKDVLKLAMGRGNTAELMRESLVRVPGKPNMFVCPSDKRLAEVISGVHADMLLQVIQSAVFSDDSIIIIDTGTDEAMVETGIFAADLVLIPIMMSRQTVKPTLNTLQKVVHFKKTILGILPLATGEAKWESILIDKYQEVLDQTPELNKLNGIVLPRIPYSKLLIRGAWTACPFPEGLNSVFDSIFIRIYGKSALPVQGALGTGEVLNG